MPAPRHRKISSKKNHAFLARRFPRARFMAAMPYVPSETPPANALFPRTPMGFVSPVSRVPWMASGAWKLGPIPNGENIFVFVARQIQQVDAIRQMLGFFPFIVDLFSVAHPSRQHLDRCVKGFPAMSHEIGAPELLVSDEFRRIPL